MAELIPVVPGTGPFSWQNDVTISGHTDTLTFRVVGGTFEGSLTEKEITPSSGSLYTVGISANVTVQADATQSVLLYYQDGDVWVLVPSMSRIFVRPQVKELDYRLLTQGMDAMPLGAKLNPTYGGLVLGGGVRIPTVQDMQQSPVAKFSDFDSSFFDLSKPVSIVHDRQGRSLYYIHTDGDVSNTIIFGGMTDVDIAGYVVKYDSTGKRSAVVFHTSGRVDVLDEAMTQFGQPTQLGFSVVRAVCRRAGLGVFTEDSYVVIDTEGRAHYLDATFTEKSVKSDHYYVNASDSYDVLSTLNGKLVGGNTSAADSTVFWYQFLPSSVYAYGYSADGNIHQFNIRDNAASAASPRPLVTNDLVVFNATANWTNVGGKAVAGMDTNGSDALFDFLAGDAPTQTRSGWSYVGLLTPPYTQDETYDRLFYYTARPVTGLKHLAIRNYDITWPDLSNIELGPSVTFTVTVDAGDPDIPLPITAPPGVTVAATAKVVTTDNEGVEHTTQVPVSRVYDGQEITITLSHPYITSSSFPVSIGHAVYQFEMKADDIPNAFSWQNILGIDNDTWNRTEDVTISGINVSVPVSVLIDGAENYDRVKIFVDGVETAMPVYIRNNQKLGFEVQHENDTTRVSVSVGQGSSAFGLYTVVEAQVDVGRHWAYVPVGKKVTSDVMKNTGTIPLVLTITDTDAQFLQGGQTITLPVGASTSIVFMPAENKQYAVKFHSDQYAYVWNVWADKQWLGTVPQTKRAERYVMSDSGTFFIDNIPDNFWTYFTIPAGMLLDIDGVRVEQELDSRGVYKEQGLIVGPFECADTMLKIYGLPSHDQPHTLQFGNATVGWLYDMTVDPSYTAYATDSVQLFDQTIVSGSDSIVQQVPVLSFLAGTPFNVILTPAFDQNIDHQLEWLTFSDAHTHAVTQAPYVVDSGSATLGQVIQGLEFETGRKDYVDNFRMADLIARSDIIFDRFDLFELQQGQKDVVTETPLPEFIGTDEGSAADTFPLFRAETGSVTTTDTFPLFRAETGSLHTIDSFPLFEKIVNEGVVSDWFWPEFVVGPPVVSDTFINNFIAHLDDAPQYFDLRSPEYRAPVKSGAGQTRPKFVSVKGTYSTPMLDVKKVEEGGVFPQNMSEARHSSDGGLFPQPMSDVKHAEQYITYHIGTAWPKWQKAAVSYAVRSLAGRYVDPIYHPIVIFLPEIPFVRWHKPPVTYHYDPSTPLRMEHVIKYPVSPAVGEFEQRKLIAAPVDVALPEGYTNPDVYRHGIDGQFVRTSRAGYTDSLVPERTVSPLAIPVARSAGKPAARPPIKVEIRKTRKAENKVYGVVLPVVETWLVAPNHGSINKPLEEGYFETELLALQNATQVWGFDASVVYAIQQPNGYWTWAQITVCEESCGSMSCAARGYLSGG